MKGVYPLKSARIHPIARQLAHYCQQLAKAGLSPGCTGEASIRDGDLIWVTPGGINLAEVQAEHLALVWPNDAKEGRVVADAELTPPTNFAWHRAFYAARSELRAVFKVRPTHTMAWASLHRIDGETSEAEPPGFQQSVLLMPRQASHMSMETAAHHHANLIAMADVGIFSLGVSLAEAFNALEELEACARQATISVTRQARQPVHISF